MNVLLYTIHSHDCHNICHLLCLLFATCNVIYYKCQIVWVFYKCCGVIEILGCKPKWMMLSLQPSKVEGQCDKFLAIEVDGVLWLSIFVCVSLVVGYEHCVVDDWQHVLCVMFKLGELCVVHCSLEEVSCLMSLKARWGGSDKKTLRF